MWEVSGDRSLASVFFLFRTNKGISYRILLRFLRAVINGSPRKLRMPKWVMAILCYLPSHCHEIPWPIPQPNFHTHTHIWSYWIQRGFHTSLSHCSVEHFYRSIDMHEVRFHWKVYEFRVSWYFCWKQNVALQCFCLAQAYWEATSLVPYIIPYIIRSSV